MEESVPGFEEDQNKSGERVKKVTKLTVFRYILGHKEKSTFVLKGGLS
jgi:hypothetical protein